MFPLSAREQLTGLGLLAVGVSGELGAKHRLVKRTSKGRNGFLEVSLLVLLLEPRNPVNSPDSSTS